MTGPARERYRKLPGRRRGFWHGASVWMGSDHLLAVRSLRFREEYKRFYLRDVQAIVVAECPRFHISTRAFGIAVLWLVAYLAADRVASELTTALWTVAALLVVAWLYISAAHSCTCRIYTAVSRDTLPSIYRTWTARRFLAKVEPRVWEVQGVLEGAWAEAAETREIGPSETAGMHAAPSVDGSEPRPIARRRSLVSDALVAALFASALLEVLTLHSLTTTVRWISSAVILAEIAAAVVVLIQHRRGILRPGMQKLAIATLILMGVKYYAATFAAGVAGAASQADPSVRALFAFPAIVVIREIDAGAELVLALIGLVLSLLPDPLP
ncbi:MAG: hypothetical protein ACHQ5A_15295 [Opitutales bacterium]